MKKMLYLARSKSRIRSELIRELEKYGTFTLIEDAGDWSQAEVARQIRDCQILFTIWDSVSVPPELADDPGELEYICHLSGTIRTYIPLELIEAGIPVTNWGDAPANDVAEGAFALLLAVMKNIPAHIRRIRGGGWKALGNERKPDGSLEGLRVGIYGYGVTGRRFVEMLRPFRPVVRIFDPYAEHVPEGERVHALEELFAFSEAVVIHAALSEETEGSVNAKLLALLPDHGIIINTARGGIVDQDALFAELESGRLRAGLDVLDGDDRLPAEHPARQWDNCLLSAHQISHNNWPPRPGELSRMEQIGLDNVSRFLDGQPLRFTFDRIRYLRST